MLRMRHQSNLSHITRIRLLPFIYDMPTDFLE